MFVIVIVQVRRCGANVEACTEMGRKATRKPLCCASLRAPEDNSSRVLGRKSSVVVVPLRDFSLRFGGTYWRLQPVTYVSRAAAALHNGLVFAQKGSLRDAIELPTVAALLSRQGLEKYEKVCHCGES